ncbi:MULTISPECIES: hypothetical protein [Peribacillus]|uniref:hypothetical protein n=1 Tax=Peribacillus TaxID=2675229 RepID=UPI001F4DB6C8|nr:MULTISPECIES: hypothetical protein [unclassified Peribacillus]MCK1982191.1 hypothetical protein [Peribacillus sp. Aquil_B1]MCK2007457.1 hypothetical protein [Peribacillus sp. Aquil_B8]
MIKNKWIIAAGMTLGLMLTGCSETTVTDSDTTEEVTEPTSNTELADYGTEMEGYLNDFTVTMTDFSNLNSEAANNPSIMLTDDWIMDISLSLVTMEEHINNIRSVDAPAEVQKSHDHVLQAMDSFQYVVDNYPNAIDNVDVELLGTCVDAMTEGGQHLDKATAELNKVTADM